MVMRTYIHDQNQNGKINQSYFIKVSKWFSTLASHENQLLASGPVKPLDDSSLRRPASRGETQTLQSRDKSYLLGSVQIHDPQNLWTKENGCLRPPQNFSVIC